MSEFLTLTFAELPVSKAHSYLLGSIGPRPIALVSTLDKNNVPNLAPFSFFNVFSARPPLLIVAPNRSGATQKNKDTLLNAFETFELVINVVNYSIVQQINIASAEYEPEVDEFLKSGLTPLASDIVKPFRVKESPIQLECKAREIIALGAGPGAGNLILCEALKIHINQLYIDGNGYIDQQKLELVGRMGGAWYCKACGENMFELPKPVNNAVGWDTLPSFLLNSNVLTGNELGRLALYHPKPSDEEVEKFMATEKDAFLSAQTSGTTLEKQIRELIQNNQLQRAWLLIYAFNAARK
jgi:flavin reductase (DIM6/NTAB) family NADH-FMN oxidoreductase RutF